MLFSSFLQLQQKRKKQKSIHKLHSYIHKLDFVLAHAHCLHSSSSSPCFDFHLFIVQSLHTPSITTSLDLSHFPNPNTFIRISTLSLHHRQASPSTLAFTTRKSSPEYHVSLPSSINFSFHLHLFRSSSSLTCIKPK